MTAEASDRLAMNVMSLVGNAGALLALERGGKYRVTFYLNAVPGRRSKENLLSCSWNQSMTIRPSFCHRVHSCHSAEISPTVQTSIHRYQRTEGRQENIPRTITPLLPNWSHMTGRVALLLRLMPNSDPSGTEFWTPLTRRCPYIAQWSWDWSPAVIAHPC